MDEKPVLGESLKQLIKDARSADTTHPSPIELEQYRLGELDDGRRLLMRQHLVLCRDCQETLLWLYEPERGAREPETVPSDDDVSRALDTLQKRIRRESRMLTVPRSWIYGAAASVLLAVFAWLFWLRSADLPPDSPSPLGRAPAVLAQINAPIIELSDRGTRQGASPEAQQVPAKAELFAVILHPQDRSTYEQYELVIVAASGRELFRSSDLSRTDYDTFVVILSRSLFDENRATLELFGYEGETRISMGRFHLQL